MPILPTQLGYSLRKQLRVTGNYFYPANVLLAFLVLEQCILQDERPHIVTEPVGVQMSLKEGEKTAVSNYVSIQNERGKHAAGIIEDWCQTK